MPGYRPAASSAENGVVLLAITQNDGFPFTRLRISLTNLSATSLLLDDTSLPWSSPYSLRLAAFDSDGRPLSKSYPIADLFGPDPVLIAPGATIQGQYDLTWLLDDLQKSMARGPVRVEWLYPSGEPGVGTPSGIGPALHGTLLLPRATFDPGAA